MSNNQSQINLSNQSSNHQLEDIEDAYLAEYVMDQVRKGNMAVYSLEETRKELGLE